MRFSLFVLFLIYQSIAFAQQLFVHPYPVDVYKGASQNWAMAQDEQGVLYFANNDGVLRYDGTSWDLIPLPNRDFVFSLAVDTEGRIYAGSTNEMGYLEKDRAGEYQYHSLMPLLPVEQVMKDIIIIKIHEDVVFFDDLENIYLYLNGELKILNIKSLGLITHQNHLYLVKENGLYVYKNESFQSMDFNKELEAITIRWITGYTNNSFLVLDDRNRLWVLDPLAPLNSKLQPFSEGLNARLKDLPVIRITSMDNGTIAIVLKNEVHFVSKNGEPLNSVTKDLFEDDIRDGFVYEDLQHNLWLNSNSLILQVITSSPLSYYDKHNGIRGTILSLGKKDQHQYIGTTYGIFYQESKTSFTLLPGTEGQVWNFYNFNQKLYVAHGSGVFELQGKKTVRLTNHTYVHSLCELSRQPDRMIMGTYNIGIWLLEKKAGIWHKNKIKGFEEETRFIQEDEEGNIWISHYNKGIYKLRLNEQMDSVISKIFYNQSNGLPSNLNNRIYRMKNGKIIAATTDGFYSYNKMKDLFEPEEKYRQALGKGFCIYTFTESSNGNIYFWGARSENKETAGVLMKQPDSTYKLLLTPFNKIAVPERDLRVDVDAPVLIAGSKEIWIGNGKKLLSYHPAQKTFYDEPFQVSIKKVWAKDSLLFINGKQQSELNIPFARNNLQFEFISSFHESPEKVVYQFKLKGFENRWSDWVLNKQAFFTNLPEGNYTFSVRAKNLYGKISDTASFSFNINPPWYRTWWAYSSYIILFIFFFYLAVVINGRRILQQKTELQRKVDEKTRELKDMNNEIVAQNEEISAISEEVQNKNQQISEQARKLEKSNATKDKLFSIVSHDLRGPIGQVLEILNLIDMNYVSEEELKTIVPRLKENIRHTIGLTDNLLFWAKNQMEEGLQLNPIHFDLLDIATENFLIFNPIALRKGIQLINNINTSFFVYADKDMIELVLRNLVNNAIKFTGNGGTVIIDSETNQGYVAVFVKDTGTGLSDNEISDIFNKETFSKYGTSGEKGTGLGLMICKEFIEINKGTITVESELGRGSVFTFRIPV